MECKYCKNCFKTKGSLKTHQTNTKYCLKLRNKTPKFVCKDCGKSLTSKLRLSTHQTSCLKYQMKLYENNWLSKMSIERENKRIMVETLQKQNTNKERKIQNLESHIKDMAMVAIKKPSVVNNIYNTIDIVESKNNKTESQSKIEYTKTRENFSLSHRETDGYIDITKMFEKGNKLEDWFKLKTTEPFLQAVSETTEITVDMLVKKESESGKVWVHPHILTDITRWISPHFNTKLSAWMYEIMMTGKVDTSNTKSFTDLQKENKEQSLRIRYLESKYVRNQPRVNYKESNVIYILTTELMRKDRRYILGKTVNLTKRLSTYNKSDEHIVVFFQGCGNEENMDLVENMVFRKLAKFRERANRERFILPEDMEINFFQDTIKSCIDFII